MAIRVQVALHTGAEIFSDWRTVVAGVCLGGLSQLLSITSLYATFAAVGVGVGPVALVPALTAIPLILMLPISIQGIGVRENLYLHFLGRLGVPTDVILSAVAIRYAVRLVPGTIGGLLYVLRKRGEATQ